MKIYLMQSVLQRLWTQLRQSDPCQRCLHTVSNRQGLFEKYDAFQDGSHHREAKEIASVYGNKFPEENISFIFLQIAK